MRIYGFIASEKTSYPVRLLCRVLGVSASAFYAWAARDGKPGSQAKRDAKRIVLIRQAWTEHRQVYGARRLTAELHERGHRINRKAVARLMRLAGIQGIHRRRGGKPGRHRQGGQLEAVAADLVRRQFTAPAPDRLWVADITYLRSWQGFLYLAVVIDACSRRVVGWAMADHLRTELVLDAVGMALFTRQPERGQLIHHSDRGTQTGLNQSSQHRCVEQRVGARRMPRRVSSSQASCGVCC
jgi:putative transposase